MCIVHGFRLLLFLVFIVWVCWFVFGQRTQLNLFQLNALRHSLHAVMVIASSRPADVMAGTTAQLERMKTIVVRSLLKLFHLSIHPRSLGSRDCYKNLELTVPQSYTQYCSTVVLHDAK